MSCSVRLAWPPSMRGKFWIVQYPLNNTGTHTSYTLTHTTPAARVQLLARSALSLLILLSDRADALHLPWKMQRIGLK